MEQQIRNGLSILSFIFVIILLNWGEVQSQNVIPSSLYAFEKYMMNSAYAGLSGGKILTFDIREQWLGLDESPKNYSLTYSSPVYELHGSYGVKMTSISSGIQRRFGLDLTYNYVYQSRIGLFSFGLGTGIYNVRIDKNKIITPAGIYIQGESNHNDPFLSTILPANINLGKFSIFGVYYYNNFEFGIIFDKEINITDKSEYGNRDIFRLNWQYLYKINQDFSIKTFGLLYTDFVLVQNDIGAVTIYRNNYLAGLNLRGYTDKTFDSLSFLIGGNINFKLRLIYSYDFTISGLQKVEDGTHEIKIIYNFGKKNIKRSLPPLINNPRL